MYAAARDFITCGSDRHVVTGFDNQKHGQVSCAGSEGPRGRTPTTLELRPTCERL